MANHCKGRFAAIAQHFALICNRRYMWSRDKWGMDELLFFMDMDIPSKRFLRLRWAQMAMASMATFGVGT